LTAPRARTGAVAEWRTVDGKKLVIGLLLGALLFVLIFQALNQFA
jgi:hypothetical protein